MYLKYKLIQTKLRLVKYETEQRKINKKSLLSQANNKKCVLN